MTTHGSKNHMPTILAPMRTDQVTETLLCERTEVLAMSQPLDVKMHAHMPSDTPLNTFAPNMKFVPIRACPNTCIDNFDSGNLKPRQPLKRTGPQRI
jgi:hypothetical protein